jgi:integrase/recombinase XerD
MPRKGYRKPVAGDGADPDGLLVWSRRYLERLRIRAYSERTLTTKSGYLQLFIGWAGDRGIDKPAEVTKPFLEAYQRHLFYLRKPSGKSLTFSSQRQRMQTLRTFFRWLTRENAIGSNPASDLELPRVERRLPRAVLSEREVEKVLTLPDTTDPLGLRDRAMMEVLYSTGLRRAELAALELFDVDAERGTVSVRLGKGKKDRVVPIGARALLWLARYLDQARPLLAVPPDPGVLFVCERGERLGLPRLTQLMTRYVEAAKVGKRGACHIFRHTMATLMLEGGADVRFIQEILGHVELSTTQVYTRISIRHLKAVHDATHPGATLQRKLPLDTSVGPAAPAEANAASDAPAAAHATKADLLAALDVEAGEEDDAAPEG